MTWDFLTQTALIGAVPAVENLDVERSSETSEWVPLFNGKNLDGWYSFLRKSGKNNDPTKAIRVEEGMLHILGNGVTTEEAEPGYLSSEQEFGDCRIRVE